MTLAKSYKYLTDSLGLYSYIKISMIVNEIKIKSLFKKAFTVDISMIEEYKRLERKASELLPLFRPLQNNN